MFWIAIDIGASFIKGAILDLNALQIRHIRRVPFPGFIPRLSPLYREVDPENILNSVRILIADLLSIIPDCEGVVFCGQMHGLVLVSERGEPLSNFISWQDQRLLAPHPSGKGSFFDLLTERIQESEKRRLGNELRPGLPLCFLFWLAERGELPRINAIPASLADFVIANLCASPPGTDLTNAAASGALNLEKSCWDQEVISNLGLKSLKWPEVRSHGKVAGILKNGSRPLPCYTPVGDQQCALIGSFLRPNELSLNIATGSQVSTIVNQLELGDYQSRPFFDGRFIKTITHIPAGRSLNLLLHLLTELAVFTQRNLPDPWDYIEKSVDRVDSTDLRVNLAFFPSSCGERGGVFNITEENLTVGHLFRASFENMAENYHSCARRLSPNLDWKIMVFSGGLAQKLKILREIIQQKFQMPYRLTATAEDTLMGLLIMALVCKGEFASSVSEITEEIWLKGVNGHQWT